MARVPKDAVAGRSYLVPVIDGAMDWLIFRAGDFDVMPPFLLGRHVWNSWMGHHAINSNWTTLSAVQRDDSEQQAPLAVQ